MFFCCKDDQCLPQEVCAATLQGGGVDKGRVGVSGPLCGQIPGPSWEAGTQADRALRPGWGVDEESSCGQRIKTAGGGNEGMHSGGEISGWGFFGTSCFLSWSRRYNNTPEERPHYLFVRWLRGARRTRQKLRLCLALGAGSNTKIMVQSPFWSTLEQFFSFFFFILVWAKRSALFRVKHNMMLRRWNLELELIKRVMCWLNFAHLSWSGRPCGPSLFLFFSHSFFPCCVCTSL